MSKQRIEQRRWNLLHWLLRSPFQRADDLALAFNMPLARVYQDIALFMQQSWLEVVTPASLSTPTCRLYCLSQRGIEALAEQEQCDTRQLAFRYDYDEATYQRLLPRLPFLIPMQQCLYSLMRYAPSVYTIQGRRCRVRWWWQRDYRHSFTYRDQQVTCAADAMLCWQTQPVQQAATIPQAKQEQESCYSLIVLLDTGLDDRTWMQQRLEAWVQWRESAERWSQYAQFPPLIILVPEAHRIGYWREILQALCRRMNVMPLNGAMTVLPPLYPMRTTRGVSAFNAWTLPWTQLALAAPVRLQELCLPLPASTFLLESVSMQSEKNFPTRSSRVMLLKGQWQQRAQCAQQAMQEGSASALAAKKELHEVPAWLSLLLGRRHLDLLTFLWNHPLLPADTIAALLTLHPDSVRRYLRELHHHGCLERWPTPACESSHPSPGLGPGWLLTERGLRLLAAMHHVHLLRVGIREPHGDTQGGQSGGNAPVQPKKLAEARRYLAHRQGLYWFLGQIHEAAPQAEQRIVWWETGTWCERSYEEEGRRHNVRPDAMVTYAGADRRQHQAWVEWDRRTMNRRDLSAKLTTYAAYVQSRVWQRESRATLPHLLFLVPDNGQEERVRQLARQVFTEQPVYRQSIPFYLFTTTVAHVQQSGPFAAIWRPVLPGEEKTRRRCFWH